MTEEQFSITLNFGDDQVPLVIPFDAVRSFVDPSVEFGLRFEAVEGEETTADESPMIEIDDEDEPAKGDAEIVSLDAFRKT